ncbi:CD63-like protein [Mya arenaria]|uniref:Tetraspanin n=1 Tax=Mya arenaria TaxID=6604 RepID=A0ABY7DX25_MYAAR|nr:CD63-like protein [Mya arenaria]
MGSGSGQKSKGAAFHAVKYTFIGFNLLGFGVLTVGIWMHLNQAPYSSLLPNSSFLGATVITICAGALLFIVGFTGCCGAILESQCMLITIEGYLREEVMLSLYRDYKQELVGTPTGGVVAVFECCGVDNHTDWYNLPEWPLKDNVPTSCCVHQYEGCGEAGSQAVLYSKGCLEEVRYWLLKNMYTLGMLALGLAVLQVLTMTAAVAMFCCLRKTSPHF